MVFSNKKHIVILPALAIISVFVANFSWVGFTGSDDGLYLIGARYWINEVPFIPDHFGLVRHTVLLPIAFSLWGLGESEFSVVLSTLVYYALILFMTYYCICRFFGLRAAALSIFLLLITPLFAVQSTIASVDMPILFYVAGSFWSFVLAKEGRNESRWLLLSGLCAGFAVLSRETAGSIFIFYSVLFCFGFWFDRKKYFLIAAGVLSVFLLETTYYWLLADNPFLRWELFLEGASVNDRTAATVAGFAADGNLRLNKLFDPLLLVFFNQEFGFTYFIAAGSIIYLLLKKQKTTQQQQIMQLFLLIACIWFIAISIALQNLQLLARYYFVPTYFLVICVAIFFAEQSRLQGKYLYKLIFIALAAGNFLCIYLENKNPKFGEKAFVEYASQVTEPLYTDERTLHFSKDRLVWSNNSMIYINVGPPAKNSLFFYNPKNIYSGSELISEEHIHSYELQPEWVEVQRFHEKPRLIIYPMKWLGIQGKIPESLFNKIVHPNPDVVVYQVN